MSIDKINIGTAPNDGTGTPLRNAFEIINENFQELEADKADKVWVTEEFGNIAPGKSAYEIALENGFIGTEQEWLDSLKGKTGDTGNYGLLQFSINEDMELIRTTSDVENFNFTLNDNNELIIN